MQTVLFDLDGTIVDSAPSITLALNQALRDFGHPQTETDTVRTLLGNDAPQLVRRALYLDDVPDHEPLCREIADRFLSHYSQDPVNGSKLYPGVLDVLTHLISEDKLLGVCTNKPHRTADPVMDALDLKPLFRTWVYGDTLPYKKPDGRHVLDTIDRCGGLPAKSVMVGDAPNDIQAAHNAGVVSILVTYGYDPDGGSAAKPSWQIDALSELPALLGTISAD